MALALLLASQTVSSVANAAEPPPSAAQAATKPAAAKPAVRARKPAPAPKVSAAVQTTPAEPAAPVHADGTVWRQTGVASWYGGKRWQGRPTASGSRYDERLLTAAHATLPIGAKVRVTLEGSDKSVVVVINDRPGTRTRIIDLSRQAAADLGILARGVALVTLSEL